ncbi:hypothetical protein ACUH96_00815 [Dermabacteraceae bacterium P13077]
MSALTAADWKEQAEYHTNLAKGSTNQAKRDANLAEEHTNLAEHWNKQAEIAREIAVFCEQRAAAEGAGE